MRFGEDRIGWGRLGYFGRGWKRLIMMCQSNMLVKLWVILGDGVSFEIGWESSVMVGFIEAGLYIEGDGKLAFPAIVVSLLSVAAFKS